MTLTRLRFVRRVTAAVQICMQVQRSLPSVARQHIALQKPSRTTFHRRFSTKTHAIINEKQNPIKVTSALKESELLRVKFSDGSAGDFPYCWLRDNCQCPQCYDHKSFTRRLVLEDWNENDLPIGVQLDANGVTINWESGHLSHYEARWLQARAFTPPSRSVKRHELALQKEIWGPDAKFKTFDYEGILGDDRVLLDWLVNMEKYGITIVQNTPRKPQAAFNIVNKVGFIKPTHYGIHYPIRNKIGANSLAYTDSKLGMHNDLPYYQYVPGIIFLHCITQFTGLGGENDLADGFWVAKYLQRHHPEEYKILTETGVYFWNKGSALVEHETTEFYKLLNIPMIVLDQSGEVIRVNNSQLRDSYLDIPVEKVKPWYRALRLYNRVMEQEAIRIKLSNGEILVMDNLRLLHGRTAYNGAVGERYMDQVFLDWDEALSRRRVLQEKIGVFHS